MTNPGSLSFANPERTRRPFAIREALSGSICHTPATVFDAVSARIAHEAGFSTGILAGSIASHVQLAAPDWIVLTLTELAQTVRTICRASAISLVVDADHGFGNPINVLRCVEELEHAGAQGITIEDTALPAAFGSKGKEFLISRSEAQAKMRAALHGRSNPDTVIVGRTSCLRIEGLDETIYRLKSFEQCGVDALMVIGLQDESQLDAIANATRLPLLCGPVPASLDAEQLAAYRVRWRITGHHAYAIAMHALHQAYVELHQRGNPADYTLAQASAADLQRWMRGESFARMQQTLMQAPQGET
ncbi:MAG: oxaloacetate decarboxylase [Betaproteobacteria bacterium]|nr:oxaloacetate decarboxylase [Betaproteobacteria bacterium]